MGASLRKVAEVAVADRPIGSGPAAVSIMRQGQDLIASVHTALDDSQLAEFQRDLNQRIGEQRTRMVIIDVAALDVIDSFAANILGACATIAHLRGAELTVVGIQPEMALAMVEVGVNPDPAHTALDLEDGMAMAQALRPPPRPGRDDALTPAQQPSTGAQERDLQQPSTR